MTKLKFLIIGSPNLAKKIERYGDRKRKSKTVIL